MTAQDDVPPLYVCVMGVTVAIAVPDQASFDRLAEQWSRAAVPAPEEQPVATITAWAGTPDSEEIRDYGVTTRVTMAALRATAGRRINLHAGGVADDQGRLLAVVAPSGTGKTTATRALSTRLGYVSDETVSIDPDGTVAPHPKPLSVIVEPGRAYGKQQLSPDDLGLLPTPGQAKLARLVVLHRGAEGPRGLVRMPTVEALLQLIEQSSSLTQLPRPLRTLLALVSTCGGVWALTYDEITDHVDELVELLADVPSNAVAEQRLAWHDGHEEFPLVEASSGPLVARLPFAEAVEVDDELLVLTSSRALMLAQLTATIWLHLAQPRSIADLVEVAEQRYGVHDRAEHVVRTAVATLEQEGLVGYGSLA